VEVYLVDGTYELFRHYYALPSARDQDGREVAAVRGVLSSVLGMIRGGATHIAIATDHVIESFRNKLWSGYKTSEGVEPDLLAQFPVLESVLSAAGLVVWPMVEFEADDALAAAAVVAARDARVERVILCTPDKDLAPMRTRDADRSTEPADARYAGRAGCSQEIWCVTAIDPGLFGTGGRFRGWLSRPARLGCEVVGRCPWQVWPSRINSRGLARMARERRKRQRSGRYTQPRA